MSETSAGEADPPQQPSVAGWYGKLPFLGDFAGRRLPPDFVQTWDEWLQRSLAASRHQLGESWLPSFLESPIWRFVLAPDVCGVSGWAGVLVPSVDRVGRYFPFTLAVSLEPNPIATAHALKARDWFAEMEQTALSALDMDFSTDRLEAELVRHPYPAHDYTIALSDTARQLAAFLAQAQSAPTSLRLPITEPLEMLVSAVGSALLSEVLAGRCFWWSVDPASGETEAHCTSGLPAESFYSVLLGASAVQAISSDPLSALGLDRGLNADSASSG